LISVGSIGMDMDMDSALVLLSVQFQID